MKEYKEYKERNLWLKECGEEWSFVYEFDPVFGSNLGYFSMMMSVDEKEATDKKLT